MTWILCMCSITFSLACCLMSWHAAWRLISGCEENEIVPINHRWGSLHWRGGLHFVSWLWEILCMKLRRWDLYCWLLCTEFFIRSLKYKTRCILDDVFPIRHILALTRIHYGFFRHLRCTSTTGSKCVVTVYRIGTQLHFPGNGGLPLALKNPTRPFWTTEKSVGFMRRGYARVLLLPLKFAHMWYSR